MLLDHTIFSLNFTALKFIDNAEKVYSCKSYFFLRVKTAVDITGVSKMFGHTSRVSSSHPIKEKGRINIHTAMSDFFSLIPLT